MLRSTSPSLGKVRSHFSAEWCTSQASGRGREGRAGTWAGLVIRLNVHLALGQHLGEFSLQLLILLVVRNSINRSRESRCGNGKGVGKQGRRKNSQRSPVQDKPKEGSAGRGPERAREGTAGGENRGKAELSSPPIGEAARDRPTRRAKMFLLIRKRQQSFCDVSSKLPCATEQFFWQAAAASFL